jgi:hypothetical protein
MRDREHVYLLFVEQVGAPPLSRVPATDKLSSDCQSRKVWEGMLFSFFTAPGDEADAIIVEAGRVEPYSLGI